MYKKIDLRQKSSWFFIFVILSLLILLLAASGTSAENLPMKMKKTDDPPPDRPVLVKHESGSLDGLVGAAGADDTLRNQMTPIGDWGIVSEKFDPYYSDWDTEAADDFVVPASDGSWTIRQVDVYGLCRNASGVPIDCGNLESANVRFYGPNGSIPGFEVYEETQLSISPGPLVTDIVRMYTINLDVPAVLPAGTYWISVQVNMDISAGDWAWNERITQDGSPHVFRNPGGAWGAGCTNWCSAYGVDPDLTFRLIGVKGNPYKNEISTGGVYSVVEHGSQPILYASIPDSNVVRVIDLSTESVIESITVGSVPQDLAISPDSSKVYVAVSGGSAVKVIQTTSNTVVDTFVLTYLPEEIAYGGPGRLYVSEEDGTIHVLNPDTGIEVTILPFSHRAGEVLAISPDGETLCSGERNLSPASVACYDITTDSPPSPIENSNIGSNLKTLDISADNSLLYTACGSPYQATVYNLSTLSQAGLFDLDPYPLSAFDSSLGNKAYISGGDTSWMWDASLYTKLRIVDHDEVKFLAAGRDNLTVYATTEDALRIYHIATFEDVMWTHWAKDWIEALYASGLTGGCSADPLLYCPGDTVTRAQMAVFLLKGINGGGYSPPVPDGSHPFTDITDHWAEAWMEDLYDKGMTSGYPDNTYRPQKQVTRAEMAVFLLRAKHGAGFKPPTASGGAFGDIGDHWAEDWIEQLSEEGITGGYPDGTYRPNNNVTRTEMAVFLVKTFDISMP